MCKRAVEDGPCTLKFVPDLFVTQELIKLRHDEDDHSNDNGLIEWYEGHQKWKAQKAKIKEELMPIAWHPSPWWDWCISDDEKKETEMLWK